MGRAQRTFDGHAVTKPKARFTGAFDLEDTEYDNSSLDNTVVCVVVAKIGDLNIKVSDTEVTATRVFRVNEMRLLEEGPLKTKIVEQLGLYGLDTLPLDVPGLKGDAGMSEKAKEVVDLLAGDTGEVKVPANRSGSGENGGPKSMKFTLDDADFDTSTEDDKETVGSIYDGIHVDPRVAAFAQET